MGTLIWALRPFRGILVVLEGRYIEYVVGI